MKYATFTQKENGNYLGTFTYPLGKITLVTPKGRKSVSQPQTDLESIPGTPASSTQSIHGCASELINPAHSTASRLLRKPTLTEAGGTRMEPTKRRLRDA